MGQAMFAPYYTRFLVRTDDIRQVKQNKIALLLNIINPDNLQPILREFIVRISSHDLAPTLMGNVWFNMLGLRGRH